MRFRCVQFSNFSAVVRTCGVEITQARVTKSVRVVVGMHRLLVHRSFRCGPVLRAFFCAIATMAVQGSVLKWVSNHRRHHLHSDKPGDVHSPHYDGVGNRHVSFVKGMKHALGGWVFDHVATDPRVVEAYLGASATTTK